MPLLFDKDTDTIGLHSRNIYREGELEELATTEDSSVVQREVRRTVRLFNELEHYRTIRNFRIIHKEGKRQDSIGGPPDYTSASFWQ